MKNPISSEQSILNQLTEAQKHQLSQLYSAFEGFAENMDKLPDCVLAPIHILM